MPVPLQAKHLKSLPSLGAWIETPIGGMQSGVRLRRSLHWERGLKQSRGCHRSEGGRSLPSLGAWIETVTAESQALATQSLPSLGAWIETSRILIGSHITSRSLHWERGLKQHDLFTPGRNEVAPFIGSVD